MKKTHRGEYEPEFVILVADTHNHLETIREFLVQHVAGGGAIPGNGSIIRCSCQSYFKMQDNTWKQADPDNSPREV